MFSQTNRFFFFPPLHRCDLIDGFSLACQIHQISQRGEKGERGGRHRHSREVFTFPPNFAAILLRSAALARAPSLMLASFLLSSLLFPLKVFFFYRFVRVCGAIHSFLFGLLLLLVLFPPSSSSSLLNLPFSIENTPPSRLRCCP